MNTEYHVAKTGNDMNPGTIDRPFLTISKAASLAQAGDTVTVHEGTYREWVKPQQGGTTPLKRITYQAADNEHVIIKGSEVIKNWIHVEAGLWQTTLDNALFGNWNPYSQELYGDWFVYPKEHTLHTGDVYLNGRSFYEAVSYEEVLNPVRREAFEMPLSNRIEYILHPEDTLYQWFAEVDDTTTTIYANFHDYNPNEETVEVNVRKCCFYPESTGVNYITVKGFEMAQAATPWTPPTADQPGLIGANWSKGWIIEDNIVHDAKCSGISIGKESSTGHNLCSLHRQKSGYQYQQEAVFRALQIGWSKETIGSHVVRNNVIYDCGQNGVVGHMGCVFSEIHNNHIYNIGIKHEFFGWEIAGIKLHAPIDVVIRNNRIHNCTLGIWLDWQAQGTRVSRNLLYKNDRDSTIEVTHGPLLLDDNIFGSDYNFDNHAQGTAFVGNLLCGIMKPHKILDRATPCHFPHSTQVSGYSFVYGGDDRIYNNIFVGLDHQSDEKAYCGTNGFDAHPSSYEEWQQELKNLGDGDEELFVQSEQPVYIDGNVYLKKAKAYNKEAHAMDTSDFDPQVKITEEGTEVYLEITMPEGLGNLQTRIHGTNTLGTPRIIDALYDGPNGELITLDRDYIGSVRQKCPIAGPLEDLKSGYNKLRVW